MDPLNLAQYTVSGIMPLLSTSLAGAYFAHKKIFTSPTIKKITISFSNFFSPVFIFIYIAGSLEISEISTFWPLLLTPSLMILLGSLVSFVHSKLFTQIPYFSRMVTCVLAFSNIGNLPVILMEGICSPYGPLQGNIHCKDANSYVALQVLTYAAIVWSYGYTLIEKDKSEYHESIRRQMLIDQGLPSEEVPPQSILKNICKNLLLPSPVSACLGLIVGLIPGVRKVFYDPQSKVYAFADAWKMIAKAGIVLGQVALGANLVFSISHREGLTKKYIASIVLFKNFIMPLCALGLVYGLWVCGVFGDNIVMAYVAFISFCAPTALVVMIMAEVIGHKAKETAWLMLWVYAFSVPGLIISTYFFFIIFKVI